MAGTHRLSVTLVAVDIPTLSDALASGGPPRELAWRHAFSDGLNSGQVSHVYAFSVTLAASGTQNLDLYGSLVSTVGETINGAKLRVAALICDGPGKVSLTRPGANGVPLFLAAGDGIELEEDDVFLYASKAGKTITTATGDLLTLAETSTTDQVVVRGLLGIRGI